MKILHLGDIHARDKDIDEVKKCLDFVIEAAKDEKVDCIINGGDTFDSKDIKLDSQSARLIIKTISEMADICPIFIVKGTESHDGMTPEILAYAKGKHKIHVATMPMQIKSLDPDIIVSMVPQPTKQYFNHGDIQSSNEAISCAMSSIFAGFGAQAADYKLPHILVYHGSISGAKLSNSQTLIGMDIEVSIDQLKLSNADLILCDHIHLPQELSDNIFYSGSLYANNYGEMHKHGFYIHTLDGHKLIESKFIETPIKKLVRFQSDFTNPDNETHVMTAGEVAGAYVRYDITVWQDEAAAINKSDIEAYARELGAIDVDIRIIRLPRETVRSESVLKVNSLRDKIKAMADLRGETVSEAVLKKADILEFGEIVQEVAA